MLATCLVDALGMARDSEDALRLFNWRKGGSARAGPNAGNFSLIAREVLERRQRSASGGLTIKELNELLDRLASSENRAEKTAVLSELIQKTNAQEMKWIIMIILKELKLGVSEKSIFHEFHPDAEDLFNVTCDLKLVCEKLRNRNQRHKRQDIEVGKPVRPQLAMRVGNANAAWKKLHGKEVVVECKFDGDRIQIHKNGQEIHFFSRNFLDHPEYEHGMSDVIMQNILVDRCILDGEMLVWDASMNRFADFGSNQEIAKAAKEGLDIDRQLCYVAFDILYVGDTSVIHQSLKERHELLRKVVKPIKGQMEILVPNGGLNDHRLPGEACWSLVANNVDQIERFFKETIENRDEGIVLKDLGSKWEPSDRSAKWLKLKPEYIRAGSDLDVLIIGGYYGSGRRGGEVAQFLVGLAEHAAPNAFPKRFISFCRVGSGLSDEERDAVITKLKPYFRKNEYPKKAPPSFYQVTNNSKERPDVWVENPEKSIILSITSDIRTIRSEVFAAPYSLRFPRVDRVRYDKPWHECLDVQSFEELVHSSNGTTQRGENYGDVRDNKPKRVKTSRKSDKQMVSVVPSQFVQTDVSDVKGGSRIFSGLRIYFVNVPSTHSLDLLHKMVVENGGSFSMNLNSSVTHCIAAESRGLKFQAAKIRGDVIQCSWLFDCCSQKKLLPLQPKYFLSLSDSSRKKLQEEIDEFSDPYYWDLDIDDIKQLLSNISTKANLPLKKKSREADFKTMDHYKRKYCPEEKWSLFQGCSIYFHPLPQTLRNAEIKVLTEVAMRRMKLEVSMGGGRVSNSLKHATHAVVSPLKLSDFEKILKSLSSAEQRLVRKKGLHVVGSQWLEDSLAKGQKLPEDTYSLKRTDMEESNSEDWNPDPNLDDLSGMDDMEQQTESTSPTRDIKQRKAKTALAKLQLVTLPNKDGKRKRGRPTRTDMNVRKTRAHQAGRSRARRGNKSAKLRENESDGSASSNGSPIPSKRGTENHETNLALSQESKEIKGKMVIEDFEIPDKEREVKINAQEVGKSSKQEQGLREDYETERDNTKTSDAIEVMADPLHSMLLNMIPSLGVMKGDNKGPVVEEPKPSLEDHNAEEPVVKKKKVSYKDLASEWLKDC